MAKRQWPGSLAEAHAKYENNKCLKVMLDLVVARSRARREAMLDIVAGRARAREAADNLAGPASSSSSTSAAVTASGSESGAESTAARVAPTPTAAPTAAFMARRPVAPLLAPLPPLPFMPGDRGFIMVSR